MDRFTLSIDLDNDAMRTDEDVARALREAADYIEGVGVYRTVDFHAKDGEQIHWHLDGGSIRDANGNTVGRWSVS